MKKMCLQWVCLLSILLLNITDSCAQNVHELFRVDTAVKFIETDILKNLYVITPDNMILKYDSGGKFLLSQQFKTNGEIASLDVSNYLNPYISYPGQNKITIVDNTLNQVSELSMEGTSVSQYSLACRSSAGGFWIYDVQEAKLKRIAQDQQQQGESPNIATLGVKILNPNYLIEYSPWLYMSIPNTGILIFDQYGAYYKTIPVKNVNRFQVFKNTVIYYQNGTLNYFDVETNDQKAVTLPFITPETMDIKVASGKYLMQTKKGIFCYSL